jgi:hypothetical protein
MYLNKKIRENLRILHYFKYFYEEVEHKLWKLIDVLGVIIADSHRISQRLKHATDRLKFV